MTYNRKLHKVVKTAGNVKIIQATLNRNDFTCHRMHLNILGKEKMAKLIGDSIKTPMTREKETPFILKWKEEQEDPHQRDTENTPTNVVSKGTQLKAAGSTKRHEETQDQIGKPLPMTTTDQNNVPSRTSNRIKKTPTTINKDFLWIKGPPSRVHQ